MPDDDSILRLLNILFEAPIDPQRWSAFLHELCATSGVSKAALIAHDLSRPDHHILACEGDAIRFSVNLYEEHYWQFDEWTKGAVRLGKSAGLFLGEEVWPEPLFRRSVFYNEFLHSYDICQVAGILYVDLPRIAEGISFYRGLREDSFGSEQLLVLKMIAPHLRTALETRRRLLALETRATDMETALDSMGTALLLVNASGKVVLLNKQARAVLAQSDCLFIHKGGLIEQNPRDTAKIRELVDKAIATSTRRSSAGGGAMPIARPDKRPLHVLVSPVSATDAPLPARAVAAIFLDDPERHSLVPAEVLRTLFRLTPAETRLAQSVLNGHSVSEAAELGGVSRETVKSQMNAVFSKTGTRRQGELVRLLARLPDQPVCAAK
jgi:DNA-binding CsgD family transcriptional regulator/PAS domain-containing protein